ncbi:MAG: hypothetical protein H5U40_06710, partial [Polyangiaceae bacterium]|nr:hypothetical protein [Polyangiaceae bacterium]
MRRGAMWAALFLFAACGGESSATQAASALLEPVRGEARVGSSTTRRNARLAPGDSLVIGQDGLARLSLDSGPRLLLDAGAELSLEESRLRVVKGRL